MSEKQLIIIIDHPFGQIEVPLKEWIEEGPGPRIYLTPIKVKNKATNEILPINAIPLRYRNNGLSRLLIKMNIIDNPWSK